MSGTRLGTVESYFAELIWEREPLSSGELVRLCKEELHWAKSTTYTVLKRLCEKGLFRNENGTITSLISKEEYLTGQSCQLVDEVFKGSLPAFFAAFSAGRKLNEAEAEEIRRLIDSQA